jgi:hypothetical protein
MMFLPVPWQRPTATLKKILKNQWPKRWCNLSGSCF